LIWILLVSYKLTCHLYLKKFESDDDEDAEALKGSDFDVLFISGRSLDAYDELKRISLCNIPQSR